MRPEELILIDLLPYLSVGGMLLVFEHKEKHPVRDFRDHFPVGQMQRLYERCYLAYEGLAGYYCVVVAIRLRTFLTEADSTAKFSMPMRDSAA